MKQKWIDAFMDTAERFAPLSSAKRLQVGAVVVKDNRITSIGYNGTPSGWSNDCEEVVQYEDDTVGTKTKDEVIHAEANAIMHCAIMGIEAGTKDAVLYTTFVPCLECSKMAITIGIKKIICLDTYPETDYDLMREAGIEIIKLDKKRVQRWASTLLDEPKR